MACGKEESPRTIQKQQVSKTLAVPISATQTPIETVAPGAFKTPAEEVVHISVPLAEDTLTTGPRLIVFGRVTLQDGSPATSATLQLVKLIIDRKGSGFVEEEAAKTVSDDNGHYRLVAQDHPYFLLNASRKGSARVSTYIVDQEAARAGERQTGTREVRHDIALPSAAYIRGLVIDEAEQPVTDIKVMALSFRGEGREQRITRSETKTDTDGRFSIEDTPPGEVTLEVHSPRHVPLSQKVTAPVEDLVLRLTSEGASLEGNVYLLSSGEAVSDATVKAHLVPSGPQPSLIPKVAKTDQFGAFSIEQLAAGSYVIEALKDDLFLVPPKDPRDRQIALAEKEVKSGIELFLYKGHTINGKVTEKNTGEPLEGVKVSSAWGRDIEKFTDVTGPEGEYLLEGLTPPQIALKAEKKGYALVSRQPHDPYIRIQLAPDNLEITQNIEMMRAVTISGVVKTADDLPVTDAKVVLYTSRNWSQRDQFTPVDESGEFTLDAEPFLPCRVKAEAPGYAASFSDQVTVQDTPVKGVDIIMRQSASITGTVVDPENQPVEGATVRARLMLWIGPYGRTENLGDTASDSRGNFTMSDLPPEEIRLFARKEGFASSKEEKITPSPGELRSGVKLVLRQSQFLAGRISNAEGEPLERVNISVYASGSGESSSGHSQTDAEGRYRIEGLADLPHNVSLHHPDYGSESHQNIEVGRDDADFVLGAKAKVTLIGRVVDWKSGEPIADFTVSSRTGARPVKDPEVPGQFKAEKLQPGMSYSFLIEVPGYSSLDTGYIAMPEDKDVLQKTFKLGPGGSIIGRVIIREAKEPLSGVRVNLQGTGRDWPPSQYPPEAITTTGEDGRFQFESASQGENTVAFNPPEPFVAQTRTIEVEHGAVADLGDVEIGGGGIIKGSVVQLPDENPVPAIAVELQPQMTNIKKKTITNDDGAFEFKTLSNGMYALRVPEYEVSHFVRLGEDETQEYILRIGAATLKGQVLQKGEPLIARISLRQTNLDQWKSAAAGQDGTFEVKNMAPGRWRVSIYSMQDQRRRIEEQIDIAPQSVTEKVFEFPAGRIVGMVVDANEAAVANAKVSARRSRAADDEDGYQPRTWTVTSQEDGSFAIEDLFPDSYGVSASKEELGIALVENIQVPRNADSELVTLRLGAVQGGTLVSVVLNLTNGEPVPEAWCHLATSSGVRFDHGQKRDDEGVMRINNIPPGTYNVQVSSYGFEVKEHTVEIKAGETVELMDVLYEAGALRWALMDKSGAPLANVDCRMVPNDPNSIEKIREGKTDANGLWIVRGLYPGEYTVTSTVSDGREVSEVVLIKEHDLTQKEVVVD